MTWWRHPGDEEQHPAQPDLDELETTPDSEAVLTTCTTCGQVLVLVTP